MIGSYLVAAGITVYILLPYICYIGKDGKPSKPFLLPQEDPDKYDYQLYSYNIPELTKGAVEVSPMRSSK